MAELSIGDAVGSGFEVIRRSPLIVLAWGVTELVSAVVMLMLFGPLYVDFIS